MMGLLAFCNPNFILLDFKGGEMFKSFLDYIRPRPRLTTSPNGTQIIFIRLFNGFPIVGVLDKIIIVRARSGQ